MKAIRLVRNEYGDFVAQEGGYYGLYYSKLEADAEFARLEDELKRYQKDHDVQLICNALEKILVRAEEKK